MSAIFGVLMATNAFGQTKQNYDQGGDFTRPHAGEGVGYIKSTAAKSSDWTSLTDGVKADQYRGKRVRMSAFVKSEDVQGWAGLWMRIDGPNAKCLGFDNMGKYPIKGTSNWQKYEVVLDVPEDSIKICYGVILSGEGQVWIGDLKFETVGEDVPTTEPLFRRLMRRLILNFCGLGLKGSGKIGKQDVHTPEVKGSDNPPRGIAIIVSSIGTDYRVEDLVRLLEKGKFSPLIIDFAWITYHWEQTKFEEVNRLLESAKKAGITVAVMYRPRFLSDPTVLTQVDEKGRNDFQHGFEINYFDSKARQWGIEWGNKILTKCPGVDEIIIYNPRNLDKSPQTIELEKKNPQARDDAIWQFMREARRAWSAQKAGVRIGVTAMQDADFWKRGVDLIDSAYPFLCVRNDENLQDQLASFYVVRKILGGKMRAALAKVTWEEEHLISPAVFAQFHGLVQSQKIPYVFWEFETLVDTGRYTLAESARILSATPDDLNTFASKKAKQKTGCEPKARVSAAQPDDLLEHIGQIPYAHLYEDFPAINSADLGLEKLEGKASLVYCSKGKKRLAGQIQTMLEVMHLMARDAAGACVRIHGLIVVGNRNELPAKARNAHWLNVDRVPCLVQELAEDGLPLQNDLDQYMIFELLLHESVDIGIKEEFGRQGQTGTLMKEDIRWIVEGLANYCANKACRQFKQYGAIRFAATDELKSLQKVTTPTLNLEETATWFPAGYQDPGDANYAYAAAHYVFARLASKHGEEWIRKTLEAMKAACVKKNTPAGSTEFCAIAGSLIHEDVRGLVQRVDVGEVKTFMESLLSPRP